MFARGGDGNYYRGFVTEVTSAATPSVRIHYDTGDSITLKRNEKDAIILDTLPCWVPSGREVIGDWPGENCAYRLGEVKLGVRITFGKSNRCLYNAQYIVEFEDGGRKKLYSYEIRLVP